MKACPSRKSPTSTLAWLPQMIRAAGRPRRIALSSTTSSCSSVALCRNSTDAAKLICAPPGMTEQLRRGHAAASAAAACRRPRSGSARASGTISTCDFARSRIMALTLSISPRVAASSGRARRFAVAPSPLPRIIPCKSSSAGLGRVEPCLPRPIYWHNPKPAPKAAMSLDQGTGFVKRQTAGADAFLGGRLAVAQPKNGLSRRLRFGAARRRSQPQVADSPRARRRGRGALARRARPQRPAARRRSSSSMRLSCRSPPATSTTTALPPAPGSSPPI